MTEAEEIDLYNYAFNASYSRMQTSCDDDKKEAASWSYHKFKTMYEGTDKWCIHYGKRAIKFLVLTWLRRRRYLCNNQEGPEVERTMYQSNSIELDKQASDARSTLEHLRSLFQKHGTEMEIAFFEAAIRNRWELGNRGDAEYIASEMGISRDALYHHNLNIKRKLKSWAQKENLTC